MEGKQMKMRKTIMLGTFCTLLVVLAACTRYETVIAQVAYLDEDGQLAYRTEQIQRPVQRAPHEFKTLDNPVHTGTGSMTGCMISGRSSC